MSQIGGAVVRAYAEPNCGPVTLEIFVADKRRGTIVLPSKYSDDSYVDGSHGRRLRSIPNALVFVERLRDAALEAKRIK